MIGTCTVNTTVFKIIAQAYFYVCIVYGVILLRASLREARYIIRRMRGIQVIIDEHITIEGSDTHRNLVHFWVKYLEIFIEILKLANIPYFNSVNFHFLVHGGRIQPMGVAQQAWPHPDIKRERLSRSCRVLCSHGFFYVLCETGVALHMH